MGRLRDSAAQRRAGTETHRAVDAVAEPLDDKLADKIRELVTIPHPDAPGPNRSDMLRPVQLEALAELKRANGLVGLIGVGHGKTLIALLAATVIGAERPMLLCPPGLVDVVLAEAERFRDAFYIRGDLVIVPYSLLSRPEYATILDQIQPDLIIADEAHHLRRFESARTKRVLRYLAEHPECRFVALSGTLTNRSVRDYAHLAEGAIGDASPIPRHGAHLASWAACIDADGDPSDRDIARVQDLLDRWGCQDADTWRGCVRNAFRRRLAASPGVVLTEASSCDCSLIMRLVREPVVSPHLQRLMQQVYDEGATPDGERVFASDDEAAVAVKQLALGFFYTWNWHGADQSHRIDWLLARSEHNRCLRAVLKPGEPGLDSPALVRQAVEAHDERLPWWYLASLERWLEVEHLCNPSTRAVWVDDAIVRHAAQWLAEQREPAILWYRDRAIGDKLRQLGLDVRGEGDTPPRSPSPCALSIRAQGQGWNLQGWRLGRVIGAPSSGSVWEQLIGRTHRADQRADVVVCDVYAHHGGELRALSRALSDARYVEQTTGQRTKLRLARVIEYTDAPDLGAL